MTPNLAHSFLLTPFFFSFPLPPSSCSPHFWFLPPLPSSSYFSSFYLLSTDFFSSHCTLTFFHSFFSLFFSTFFFLSSSLISSLLSFSFSPCPYLFLFFFHFFIFSFFHSSFLTVRKIKRRCSEYSWWVPKRRTDGCCKCKGSRARVWRTDKD